MERKSQPRRPSRREAISVSAAGALGLSLADFLPLQAAPASGSFGAAKAVIFIFLHGGHPQHETWDPKPRAPAEVRGEFGDIATSLPGYRISELLPQCAKLADQLTVVRSMAHDNTNHVQACLPAMTGHKHLANDRSRGDFPPSPNDFPHFGAVLDHLQRDGGDLPNWVQLGPLMTRSNGTVLHGQSAGFLGDSHAPFLVDQDLTPDDVQIAAIQPHLALNRIRDRQRLLEEVDAQRQIMDEQASRVKNLFYRKALALLTSPKTRDAFDLAEESAATRQRYGDHHVGQACLLARRLVEAGVPFVNVHYCKTPNGSWDTHSQNFKKMKESLAPTLDQALSALLEDLDSRGMLEQTLVAPMAEFGRTPTINKNAGRDHWPFVYSLALAGAGLQPGAVLGKSDRLGAYPESTPFSPADMAATLYHLLGVPEDITLYDAQRRPHQLVIGNKIEEILA